jgi:RHS repeat-associated protein
MRSSCLARVCVWYLTPYHMSFSCLATLNAYGAVPAGPGTPERAVETQDVASLRPAPASWVGGCLNLPGHASAAGDLCWWLPSRFWVGGVFYNARYYDPGIGRFVSADSIVPGAGSLTLSPHDVIARGAWGQGGGGPGNPQALNRYSYGLNNPVRNTDPTGHCPVYAVVGAIAGAGIAYGVQVYANTQRGMDLGQAMTTDINYAAIGTGAVAGAVIGGTLGIAAGASGIAGYTVGSAIQLGAVGAASNMAGNALSQYATTGTINTTDLAVAGITGFAAGAAAPIVASTGIGSMAAGYVGSIGLGATAMLPNMLRPNPSRAPK